MRVRNPESCCGNCVYWADRGEDEGECRKSPPSEFLGYVRLIGESDESFSFPSHKINGGINTDTGREYFCGEHPEFWKKEVEWGKKITPSPILPMIVLRNCSNYACGGEEEHWIYKNIETCRNCGFRRDISYDPQP